MEDIHTACQLGLCHSVCVWGGPMWRIGGACDLPLFLGGP